MSPAEFRIRNIALVAIGRAEILADLGDAIEFVLRHVLRHPVAPVIGEVQLPGFRIPVEPDGVAHAKCDHFGAGAIEIDPPDLAMRVVMQDVVAGLSDRNIQLVVGPDGDELPAVGFILRQLVVDDGRFRRIVEIVFDLVDLGDLRKLGDVERAVVEGDAVGPVEARGQHLDRSLAVLVDDAHRPCRRDGCRQTPCPCRLRPANAHSPCRPHRPRC